MAALIVIALLAIVVVQNHLIKRKEQQIMALGQDILTAIAAETTVIDSFIALVQGLVANNTIPADAAQAIFAAIAGDKAKLEAAIIANTPPTP